jgi:hypothetical protein
MKTTIAILGACLASAVTAVLIYPIVIRCMKSKKIFDRQFFAFVIAVVSACAAAQAVDSFQAWYHRNDLITVTVRMGATVVSTNQMTLSGYHRWLARGLSTQRTISEWGNPMFIPTNNLYDRNF